MIQSPATGVDMQTFGSEHLEIYSLWCAVELAYKHAFGEYGKAYVKYLQRFSVSSKQALSMEPIPEILRQTWVEVSSAPHDVQLALLHMDISRFLNLEVETTIKHTIADAPGPLRVNEVHISLREFETFQQHIKGMYELMRKSGFKKTTRTSATLLTIFRNEQTNQLDGFIDNMKLLQKIMTLVGRINNDVSDSEIVYLGHGSALIEINIQGGALAPLFAVVGSVLTYLGNKQSIHENTLKMLTKLKITAESAYDESLKAAQSQIELAKSYARQSALDALNLADKEKESSANILFNDLLELFEERDGQMIPKYIDYNDPGKKEELNQLLTLQEEYHEGKQRLLSYEEMAEQLRLGFSEEE